MTSDLLEFLGIAFIIAAVMLPGNMLRWIRYRTLGDFLAAAANIALLAAAAWDWWGWNSGRVLSQLVISVVLWSVTGVLVLLFLLQTQIVAPEYYQQRVKGKDWMERALFAAGFVWFGVPPDELDPHFGRRIGNSEDANRPARYVWLICGLVFFMLAVAQELLIPDWSPVKRLTVHCWTLGLLCLAVGAVDVFVVRQRRKLRTLAPLTHCEKCGYDLRGLLEPRCPECGRPFERDSP